LPELRNPLILSRTTYSERPVSSTTFQRALVHCGHISDRERQTKRFSQEKQGQKKPRRNVANSIVHEQATEVESAIVRTVSLYSSGPPGTPLTPTTLKPKSLCFSGTKESCRLKQQPIRRAERRAKRASDTVGLGVSAALTRLINRTLRDECHTAPILLDILTG